MVGLEVLGIRAMTSILGIHLVLLGFGALLLGQVSTPPYLWLFNPVMWRQFPHSSARLLRTYLLIWDTSSVCGSSGVTTAMP